MLLIAGLLGFFVFGAMVATPLPWESADGHDDDADGGGGADEDVDTVWRDTDDGLARMIDGNGAPGIAEPPRRTRVAPAGGNRASSIRLRPRVA